jgi:hypothetical protein
MAFISPQRMVETDRQCSELGDLWRRFMLAGRFEDAWQISDQITLLETRQQQKSRPRHYQHIWDGTPLPGRRVRVRCYHGLGDTIHFSRYLPLLKSHGCKVDLECQPELLPLMSSVAGVDSLHALDTSGPSFDVEIEIMELPYAFRTTLQNLPAAVPYVECPATPRIPRGVSDSQLNVGLVWYAGDWDRKRNIELDQLAPLAEIEHINWFSVQRPNDNTGVATYLAPHGMDLTALVHSHTSILATATIISQLDLLISIDTMPAHLAGALGRPVWTLLQFECDWRWMSRRTDSPWYPTMRLFRQACPHDWRQAIDEVRESLRTLIDNAADSTTHFESETCLP